MSYRSDRQWSDQFIPAIRQIVGPLLLEPAPLDADRKQATDLIVLNARDMKIAARVRRHGYAERYPYEFTIRSHRDNGAPTELEKITYGFGDWFFYGHASDAGPFVTRWMVIDLRVFRGQRIQHGKASVGNPRSRSNGDGTHFYAFDVRAFRPSPPILVASSEATDRSKEREAA